MNKKKEQNKPDIFDRILSLSCFNFINPFYIKHKDVLLYIFWGGVATVLNITLFALFNLFFDELISNIISWVITVLFVYITNKTWVFKVEINSKKQLIVQIFNFFISRLGTLVIEELIIFVFITLLEFNNIVIKVIAQIVVIVTNYILSKLFVFRKQNKM